MIQDRSEGSGGPKWALKSSFNSFLVIRNNFPNAVSRCVRGHLLLQDAEHIPQLLGALEIKSHMCMYILIYIYIYMEGFIQHRLLE